MVRFGNDYRKSLDGLGLPEYTVRDIVPDVVPPMDVWAEYLRVRYSEREAIYRRLDPSGQELIRKEIRRIRYFRHHFRDYRVSSADKLPLVALLDDSRTKWRDAAYKRAAADLARCHKEMERHGDTPRWVRERDILRFVQTWKSKAYPALQEALYPDTYMGDLESGPDHSEDNPRESNYGYNGWITVWEDGIGGVSMDHPLVHGQFPHQKISIQQLLYNKEQTPLRRSSEKNQFRHFHLPANSMQWVEDAISRYYGEEKVEFDGHRGFNIKSHAERLLRNERWRGQQRGGSNLPTHSRQIGARCSFTPSAPTPGASILDNEGRSQKDIALFMPFLHWEVEKRLHRMAQFVQVAKSRQDHHERLRRASTTRSRGRFVDVAKIQATRPARPVTGFEAETRKSQSWRPQLPLAKYLWHVAKLYQIIDEAADGRLIDDHLYASPPLHVRRTLEQFYYWTADDTTHRDRDQVVCRATQAHSDDSEATARIVMVDQLWMWILDENTVISSFPRRWGRNKPDPSAVHRAIRDRLGTLEADEIQSVYDLAFIVVDECSNVFFDRTKPLDQRPEVIDIFSSAISTIAEKKTIAYAEFGDAVSQISIQTLEAVEKLIRRSLNIGFEWSILVEAQQVIDELQIMQEIFAQQVTVMKDFDKTLRAMYRNARPTTEGETVIRQRALEGVGSLVTDMEQRRDELASMERLQTKTRAQLRELLDMKQQQSNIIEAKAAIQRADETVLQGRSIVVFTVVTIFFLPLSFFASVFGMNAPELTDGGIVPLHRQLTYMSDKPGAAVGISSAVIFVSLALAFSTWTRTALAVTFNVVVASVENRMGWRNKKSNFTSAALKSKQRAMFQRMDSQAIARKVTEISTRAATIPQQAIELRNGALRGDGSRGARYKGTQMQDGFAAV